MEEWSGDEESDPATKRGGDVRDRPVLVFLGQTDAAWEEVNDHERIQTASFSLPLVTLGPEAVDRR